MGYIVRLVILFAVVAGISYAVIRAVIKSKQERLSAERAQALEKIAALEQAHQEGELSEKMLNDLKQQIVDDCANRGIDLGVNS